MFDKFFGSKKSVIESWINFFTMKSMICRANDALCCSSFQTTFKRTKMNNKITFIYHFIIRKTGSIILQRSV